MSGIVSTRTHPPPLATSLLVRASDLGRARAVRVTGWPRWVSGLVHLSGPGGRGPFLRSSLCNTGSASQAPTPSSPYLLLREKFLVRKARRRKGTGVESWFFNHKYVRRCNKCVPRRSFVGILMGGRFSCWSLSGGREKRRRWKEELIKRSRDKDWLRTNDEGGRRLYDTRFRE